MRLPRDVSGMVLQKSLRRLGYERVFHKSPLKSQAVDGATIYDISLAINTEYGAKSRHSRENGNLEAGIPVGFKFVKHALRSRSAARFSCASHDTGHREYHEVIPQHNPVKAKTLLSILKSVARHHGMSVDELLGELEL